MLGKKKKQATESPADSEMSVPSTGGPKRSHPLRYYFVPIMVVSVLAIAAFTFISSWVATQAATERQIRLAHSVAVAVEQQVAEMVGSRGLEARLLAAGLKQAHFAGNTQQLKRIAQRLQTRLPAASRVILIPSHWEDERVLAALGGSYAAADMFRAALESEDLVPAEAIRDADGGKYLMLAVPAKSQGHLVGVLFVGFPLAQLSEKLQALDLREAYVAVEQVFAGGRLLLAGAGDLQRKTADGSLKIPGTIWQVRYAAPAMAGMAWSTLLALVLGGALLVLVVILWGYQRLAKALKGDVAMLEGLVQSVTERQGAATPTPHLLETRNLMQRLARYAQSVFNEQREEAPPAQREKAEKQPSAQGVAPAENVVEEVQEPLPEEKLPVAIFRSGVIRGRAEKDFDETLAQGLGLSLGTQAREAGERCLFIARDNRPTSDAYASALVAGALATGCDVVDLGEIPTPLLNFALHSANVGTGIMVTGGGSPPDYNGFKVYFNGQPVNRKGYRALRQHMLEGRFLKGVGRLESRDFSGEYLQTVANDIQLVEPLRLVLDCGNGVTGALAQNLFQRLGCEVIPLYCEPDGQFPNHPGDVSDPDNLVALSQAVKTEGAQLGIALDVDGDALAVVDEKGKVVAPDHLLMLLAGDIIRRNPGADVVYDLSCTSALPEYILANGGRPIMWRNGHAEMQGRLQDKSALLAGEVSGHFYINERWHGFDDGLYTAVRLLEIFSLEAVPVSLLFNEFSANLVSTPLLRTPIPEGKGRKLVALLKEQNHFGKADIIDKEGLRVEYPNAWGVVRASNTRPLLLFRFEAADEGALQEVQGRFREAIKEVAPDLSLPF